MIKHISRILMLLALGCSFTVHAADVAETTGTVVDEYDNPIAGAVVYDENGKSLGTTDADGVYTCPVTAIDKKVKIEFLGRKTVETTLESGMKITLPYDNHNRNQKLNMGNHWIEANNFGGAVDVQDGESLLRRPASQAPQVFQGNFAGLVTQLGAGELSHESYYYYLRGLNDPHAGSPLIVIDGNILYPGTEDYTLRYITPEEIEQITILKDAASQALYGGQGASGVMVITTKRGTAGKPRINVKFDVSINQQTVTPDFIDSYTYARLRKEAGVNDGHGANYYFTDEQVEGYRTQSDSRLYPNNNWRNMFMKKNVFMERLYMDVQGGNEWVNYYANVTSMHTGGFFKTENQKERLGDNAYDPNNNYWWFNFRSNISAKITNWLSARVNLGGNIRRETRTAGGDLSSFMGPFYYVPPTTYGPLTPYNYDEEGNLDESDYPGGELIVTDKYSNSIFGQLNRVGTTTINRTNVNSNITLDFNLNGITKGLSATAVLGYHTYTARNLNTTQAYRRYQLDQTALNNGTWTFIRYGSQENTSLAWSSSSSSFIDMNYRAYVNYNRTFGKHAVQAQAFSYLEHYENANLPYEFINMGVDANYTYDNRYSVRFVFSNSGSDLFSRDSRWQKLPAFSLAYNIHNEEFLKDNEILTLAKLRYTWGKTGNVRSTGIGRYTFDDQMKYASGGGRLYNGDLITETLVGNPGLHAETIKKWNIGVDLGFLNMVTLTFDVFKEKMNDWIITNTVGIPEYQGAPLSIYPVSNAGRFRNAGYELTAKVAKQYKDWEWSVNGYMSYTTNKVIYSAEADRGENYVTRYRSQGYPYGSIFGYEIDYSNGNGMFNFQEDIDNWATYGSGTPRLGDFRYKDQNGDGVINDQDVVCLSKHGAIPAYTFSINGYVRYKNVDFNIGFYGTSGYDRAMSAAGVYEYSYDGVFSKLHLNAWTAERWANNEKITWPALSANSTTSHRTNSFYVWNMAFWRLKDLEIGYNFPRAITEKLHMQALRVYTNGTNLLYWDNTPDGYQADPEATIYTVNPYRTFNLGVRVSF